MLITIRLKIYLYSDSSSTNNIPVKQTKPFDKTTISCGITYHKVVVKILLNKQGKKKLSKKCKILPKKTQTIHSLYRKKPNKTNCFDILSTQKNQSNQTRGF